MQNKFQQTISDGSLGDGDPDSDLAHQNEALKTEGKTDGDLSSFFDDIDPTRQSVSRASHWLSKQHKMMHIP